MSSAQRQKKLALVKLALWWLDGLYLFHHLAQKSINKCQIRQLSNHVVHSLNTDYVLRE